ncbi:MAG TPA: DUF5320 domain-containing protein [Candidatus Ozemobacteraceae bacterium]|nr:DUF5320 domain-containing protein [Candidatus Ozemobacteraceae bacterium]
MPYGDGTGPHGAGPMTGRGMGPCSGNAGGGFQGRGRGMGPCGGGFGFGRGRGLGRGRGFRNGGALAAEAGTPAQAQPALPVEARLDILQRQIETVSGQIEALRNALRHENLPVEEPKKDPDAK